MARKLSNEEFINKIKDLVGEEYTFLEEYQGTHVKLKVRHNCKECNNNVFEIRPNDFISQGSRCNHEICKSKSISKGLKKAVKEGRLKNPIKRKTNNDFIKEVFDKVGDEYTFLEPYVKNNIHLKVIHNTCGHEYSVTPVRFLSNGRRCPKCSLSDRVSKGHKCVEAFLKYNNIKYKKEVTFEDCLSDKGRPLRFDFEIEYLGRKFLLEYDGNYHKTGWKGDSNSLNTVQRHDTIKENYCIQSGLELHRFESSYETDYQEILDYLNKMFNSSTTIENLGIS